MGPDLFSTENYDEWVVEIFQRWNAAQIYAIQTSEKEWRKSVVSLPGYIIRRLRMHSNQKHLERPLLESLGVMGKARVMSHEDMDLVPEMLKFLKEAWNEKDD